MSTATKEEAKVRQSLKELVRSLQAKDIDALMAHYAPDTVVFDIRPPHRIDNVNAYRKNFEAWFASVDGPINYDVHELDVDVREDVAFCHSLCHVKSERRDGEQADYWVRVTSGLRNLNGRWLITHEHISMPIELQTMRAKPKL